MSGDMIDTKSMTYKKRDKEQTRSQKFREAAKRKYEVNHVHSVQLQKNGAFVQIEVWMDNDEISGPVDTNPSDTLPDETVRDAVDG